MVAGFAVVVAGFAVVTGGSSAGGSVIALSDERRTICQVAGLLSVSPLKPSQASISPPSFPYIFINTRREEAPSKYDFGIENSITIPSSLSELLLRVP